MLTGEEKPCPAILENYGFEAIWRLRTDTWRRLKRLIKTLYYFGKGLLFKKFDQLNGSILK